MTLYLFELQNTMYTYVKYNESMFKYTRKKKILAVKSLSQKLRAFKLFPNYILRSSHSIYILSIDIRCCLLLHAPIDL